MQVWSAVAVAGSADLAVSWSDSATATRRCWAPSWRSRSILRRASAAAATMRARDSWSRVRASTLAIALRNQLGERTEARLRVSSEPVGRRAHCERTPQLAIYEDRRGDDRLDPALSHLLGEAPRHAFVGVDPRWLAGLLHTSERAPWDHLELPAHPERRPTGKVRSRPRRNEGREPRSVVAHGHCRVCLQVAPDLLGDEREHGPGRMRSRDERRDAAQRLLLPQTRTQGALEALVLNRELRGIRLRRLDSPIAHGTIVPRMRRVRSPAKRLVAMNRGRSARLANGAARVVPSQRSSQANGAARRCDCYGTRARSDGQQQPRPGRAGPSA